MRDENVIVIFKKVVQIFDGHCQWDFLLADLLFMFQPEYSEMQQIVLEKQLIQQIFSGLSEKGRNREGQQDGIDEFDALTIIFYLFQPPQTNC